MDLFYLPDVLRGLNTNPTLKMLDRLGATKKKGEKFITIEEFYPIYSEVSNSRIVTLDIARDMLHAKLALSRKCVLFGTSSVDALRAQTY